MIRAVTGGIRCERSALIFFSGVGVFLAQEKQKPEEKSLPAAVPHTTTARCPDGYKITPEDTARPNPVRFTEASVVRGRRIYFYQCAMCHGEKGDVTLPDSWTPFPGPAFATLRSLPPRLYWPRRRGKEERRRSFFSLSPEPALDSARMNPYTEALLG
jgi:hypothetical protein